jgi:hypothetical protein
VKDFPDLLVEHDPGDRELARVLAEVFAVAPDTVHIIDGIEHPLGPIRPDATLLVERRQVRGEAALHLQISLLHPDAERMVQTRSATLQMLKQLANRLGGTVITDDEGLDPSAFLAVRPEGEVEAVALDIDRLDEQRYVSVVSVEQRRTLDGGTVAARGRAPGVREP